MYIDGRSHREELLQGGFSENITLLQRRPVEDLAKTLALAYALREERVTDALNEANAPSEPSTPSNVIIGAFKFGKDDEKSEAKTPFAFRRVGSISSTTSAPSTDDTSPRWGWFKNNSSSQPNLAPPKTPPDNPITEDDPPTKFSPGSWGASLSVATRKLNKFRISSTGPASPESPSSSKSAVHLDDRLPENQQNQTLTSIKGSTSNLSARVSAAVRDSFERRNEILQKVGGWVSNTHDPETRVSEDWEVVSPHESGESRANEEIKRLEGELGRRKKSEISPEEYIARIKKRREARESRETKPPSSMVDDPLGVDEV